MSEILRHHTTEELRELSLDELRAMWELVPTDRQRSYRAAYDREVKPAKAADSDVRERKIALALLKRYDESALVPLGLRWARTPNRVQDAAIHGVRIDTADAETAAKNSKPSGKVLAVLGVMMLCMFALIFMRSAGSTGEPDAESTATSTPLALEAQDNVIQGGDASRVPFYPINLQIAVPGESVPRVWVVQRRAVQASEWNFDPNPDTASFLNGMSVRPVIGIPWSEDNAA